MLKPGVGVAVRGGTKALAVCIGAGRVAVGVGVRVGVRGGTKALAVCIGAGRVESR